MRRPQYLWKTLPYLIRVLYDSFQISIEISFHTVEFVILAVSYLESLKRTDIYLGQV
jgi:hypothetical protein